MIFNGERHGLFHSFTMDVDPSLNIEETSEVVVNGICLRVKTFFKYLF